MRRLILRSAPASAASFQIAEQSASGIGNAFAGGAVTENAFCGNLSADYKGSVQIFSAQARWTF